VAAEAAAAPFELVEPAESAMRAFETDAGGDGDGVRENDAASASEGCIDASVNANLIVLVLLLVLKRGSAARVSQRAGAAAERD
jgi:hypothetical protein